MESDRFIRENPILFKKYKVKKKIGQGAFGAVFLGQTIKDNESVAIKIEKRNIVKPLLKSEAFLLAGLKGIGIPKVISFGTTKFFTVLIEPLFGKTLFDIFIQKGKQFPIEELCLIALQVIERLETIHLQYVIHRDIKPDNFLIGKEDPNIIYLVDFGLSKKYRSSQTGRHVKFKNTGRLTGTLRFASPNALRGGEQSRKDDLISAGYMLIYLMRKKLPWQVVKAQNSTDKYIKIYKMKKAMKPQELCQNLPNEMAEYMRYVQHLGFESNPDYNYLKKLFHHILAALNLNADKLIFSWIKQSDIKKLKKKANPHSRTSSPQQRLYKKISENLQGKQRGVSSSDTSENNSYEAIPNIIKNPNIKMQRNYSKDNLEASDITKLNSKNNTIMVNFDKTINNQLLANFENIDKQLESNDTLNDQKGGIFSQKTVQTAKIMNFNDDYGKNIFPQQENHREKISDIISKNSIPQENVNIEERLKNIKENKEKFYKEKLPSKDENKHNNEINNNIDKKNSGEQLQEKNSLEQNIKENKQQINMGAINMNNIKPLETQLKNNNLKNDEVQKNIIEKNGNINNNIMIQKLPGEFGKISPRKNNNFNLLQKNNLMLNNINNNNNIKMNNMNMNMNNMNMKKTSKSNNNKNMKNPNNKKINQKKVNIGNNNINNYFPSNTEHNQPIKGIVNNNRKNNRNMQQNFLDNNNFNNMNFIAYTEPSDTGFNGNMKIHKVQTVQNNTNYNAFKEFNNINNNIYGKNGLNFDMNNLNLNVNNNMNPYNQMNKNMLMNNKININGINKQIEPKKKSQKKQNNNKLGKTNQIIGNINNINFNNMNMNMNININMNKNNNMMANRNLNRKNNNINNPYNHQGINYENNMMMNNNYFPNDNMIPNDNMDYMQNYNIQNNNNIQGQMSAQHHRYGMNNPNKNIKPFRYDKQQYQDFNEF